MGRLCNTLTFSLLAGFASHSLGCVSYRFYCTVSANCVTHTFDVFGVRFFGKRFGDLGDAVAGRHDPPAVDGEAEVQTPGMPEFYESYPNADGAEQFFERHPEARPAHAPLPVVREEIKIEEPEEHAPTTPNPSSPTEVAPEEVMEVVTPSVALMTIQGELDGAVAPLTEAAKLALAEPSPAEYT